MEKLPENFETYGEARKAGFLKMKSLKDEGKRIVGTFCTYVPTEVIEAADATAVSLCASSDEAIPAAEEHLPRILCPLIKASYGFALTDKCPYFYFSDIIVGETTCDGKKKMYELMNEIKETYVLQLPSYRDEVSLNAWKQEIDRFRHRLEDLYHITITEDDLRRAIHLKNKERQVIREFLELGKLNPSPLTGYELGSKLDALGFNPNIEERTRLIAERTAEVKKDWEENYKGKPSKRPRILVTGCPNSGVRDKTIKAIEEMGADVVAFDSCNGVREKMELVDETMEPLEALARKYLNINCSIMSPNQGRLDTLKEMMEEYQIDGVMDLILQACHTFNIESYNVKRVVEGEGKPYLKLELDFAKSDAEQIKTRLQAFLETILK